jgi:nucleoside diphosphate kinase
MIGRRNQLNKIFTRILQVLFVSTILLLFLFTKAISSDEIATWSHLSRKNQHLFKDSLLKQITESPITYIVFEMMDLIFQTR